MADPRLSRVHLIVAGGSGDRTLARQLHEMAAREPLEGRIHFLHWVDDLEKGELFKLADLFVLSSRKENFGMAAAEAVISGLPAVVTRGCGVAPLIDGRGGLACGHEPSEIAEEVDRILSDEAELLRLRAGTAQVAQEIDGLRTVARLEAICWELSGARPLESEREVPVGS
jgi:glycosyltransferase involved in cell wall biosynthesis